MLELTIVRHGHAPIAPDDHARTLSEAGRQDARAVGERLAELQRVPEHVICSTAQRTRSTTEAILQAFQGSPSVTHTRSLYAPSGSTQPEDSLYEVANDIRRVLVVGHNPTLDDAVHRISGLRFSLRPASWVHMVFNVESWTSLATAHAQVLHAGHAGTVVLDQPLAP